MKLTDTAIKNAKPKAKPYKITDGAGLYVEVAPSGGKWWRFKYSFEGREKRLSFGVYPEVPLKLARERREAARKQVAAGIDPSAKRQSEKAATANTFEAVAREWFTKFAPQWKSTHATKIIRRLEKDVFPWIGSRPIATLAAADLLSCIQRIEKRGAVDTAHRAMENCGQVLDYAVATARAENNPTRSLKASLSPRTKKGFAWLRDSKRIGELLRAIDSYPGSFEVASALKLAPLVFVRPGELRGAEWSEIDFDAAMWVIPGGRMKGGEDHMVPLSKQAVAILREIEPLTGRGRFVFRGNTPGKSISENTLSKALSSLGFSSTETTPHGFRKTASTLLNEQGFNRDWIEVQLAHKTGDVRGVYNRAEYLSQRTKMMQWWADHLEGMKAGGNVFQFKRRASR